VKKPSTAKTDNMFGSYKTPRNVTAGGSCMSPTKRYRIAKAASPEKIFRKKVDFSPLKKILNNNGGQMVKTSPIFVIQSMSDFNNS
jgi:hypothetical protein